MNSKLAAKLNPNVSLQYLKVSAQIQHTQRLQHANKHSNNSSNLQPCTPVFKLKIAGNYWLVHAIFPPELFNLTNGSAKIARRKKIHARKKNASALRMRIIRTYVHLNLHVERAHLRRKYNARTIIFLTFRSCSLQTLCILPPPLSLSLLP